MGVASSNLISHRASHLVGSCQVPGDKSISHRALMLAAIAQGTTEISGFLPSEDCLATLRILTELGVVIQHDGEYVSVAGVGMDGLQSPRGPLDCGNSGTAMRLLAGLLCGQKFSSVLSGDTSLCQRPMLRIVEPLRQMGAMVQISKDDTPPIQLNPVDSLHAIDIALPIASAQLKSCLLLAGLYAEGVTSLTGAIQTRDHTERMLIAFGCPLEVTQEKIVLDAQVPLQATQLQIPGDLSSAAFLIVAACLVENSDVVLEGVGINPTRSGVLQILQQMGANIEISQQRVWGEELVADIHVRSSKLQGIQIPSTLVANAIDEFPILFVAAACAEGVTELSNAQELRHKESDRIRVMAQGLRECGVDVQTKPDGLVIQGGGKLSGGQVHSYGDHRVAMAFAVAGLVAEQAITIQDCANINTSFPDFILTATKVGFCLE